MWIVTLLACAGPEASPTGTTPTGTMFPMTPPPETGITASDTSTATGTTGDTAAPTLTPLEECFASHGLTGTCGPDEVSWAAIGPHGCAAGLVTGATVELQYDTDGDVQRVVFGPDDPNALEVTILGGARFADQLVRGVGVVGAVPWRDADAALVWGVPLDDSATALAGYPVSGTFTLTGGEVDLAGVPTPAPYAEGAGCFDGMATLAGYFP